LRPKRWQDQWEPDGHREASGRDESADRPGERSEVERVDDPTGARSDGAVQGAEGYSRDDARLCLPGERGPVNGFWGSANWVLTRPQRVGDRPGLRPVERGAFPLAHGATARVGRLRGYGDGIVAQAAKAFILAYASSCK
jgi:DNA (cytosine-5)-methyltransferase 1